MAAAVELINKKSGEKRRMWTIDAKELLSGKGASDWEPFDPDAEARRQAQREAAAAVKAATTPERKKHEGAKSRRGKPSAPPAVPERGEDGGGDPLAKPEGSAHSGGEGTPDDDLLA